MPLRTFILPKDKPRDLLICAIVERIQDLPESEGFRVEIHEHRGTRSDKQNRTLWWIYDNILKFGGESMGGWRREDLHEFFLCLHFGAETRKLYGKNLQRPVRRSSKLSKIEFANFVDHIYQFMAEQGVYLPNPDPDKATFEKAA